MEDPDKKIRIRAEVTKETRDLKNKLEVSWQRVMDLGLEQVEKVFKEVEDLDMIGAYTPAWVSARGVLRLVPHARVDVGRMQPLLIYYIIEIGRGKLRTTTEPRFFKLFYKLRKEEKMQTKIFNIAKVRKCIMEEFGLDNEDRIQW